MRSHDKHVLICTGSRCSDNTQAFQQLRQKIDTHPVGCAEARSASFVILMRFTAFSTSYDRAFSVLERTISKHILRRLGTGDA